MQKIKCQLYKAAWEPWGMYVLDKTSDTKLRDDRLNCITGRHNADDFGRQNIWPLQQFTENNQTRLPNLMTKTEYQNKFNFQMGKKKIVL